MGTKRILGLDIGTNSIGAALINLPKNYLDYGTEGSIEWMGSRIIPVDGDYLQKFQSGAQAETKAAARRMKRGSRRLKHRYKLRRSRLIKIFKALGFITEDFPLDNPRTFKHDLGENGYSLKISDYLPFSAETIDGFEKEFGIDGKKSKHGKSIVPEDWIIYYLRKEALIRKITYAELARIIYMLNQRRGFKSSRKDLKDTNVLPYNEFVERKEKEDFGSGIETQFVAITKVKSVTFKEEKKDKKGNTTNTYIIAAEDPRMEAWEETRRKMPEWVDKEFTFLVVQKIDKNGKLTQNKPQLPGEDSWALCTTALSEKIEEKHQHPGEYFYQQIKNAYKDGRNFKARQYPVYRWRYQKELEAIWKKQCELNPELTTLNSDKKTLAKLAEILYPTQAKNKLAKLTEFIGNDLLHIISNDIIYYQRELKSQKDSINECRYEKRKGIDGEYYGLKCIPRSSPLFQEFRIWQDIHNLRLLKKEQIVDGKTKIDVDVSNQYIDNNVKEKLFDLFNSKASISESDILNVIKDNQPDNDILIAKKGVEPSHRVNLFARRGSLKGNETLSRYRNIFKKVEFNDSIILEDEDKLMRLWHIDYSISSSDEKKSEKGIMTALGWERKNDEWITTDKWENFKLPSDLALSISKLPELKKEYGSYSACAIKKLLAVMRSGKYWEKDKITAKTRNRIEKLITAEFDENVNEETRKKLRKWEKENGELTSIEDFSGMPTWLACYVVYGIHSENSIIEVKNYKDFSTYIQKKLPNNSIGNPIVEQVTRETMYVVRDLWKKFGDINEIHIELGRDLKNNSKEKERITEIQTKNFNEKQRIKGLLYELMNDGFEQYIDDNTKEATNFEVNPNPESPIDIDKFRLWKSLSGKTDTDWAKKVKDEKIPTDQEIKKYILWLSQNCRSPYTGKIIPLSKLFDKTEYEIEHVIPRKRMKNDSFNNLVIAEAAINPDPYKGNLLARNFISQFGGKAGKKYEINGRKYFILGEEEYEAHCKETFKFQKAKLKNLLATEVPDDFVERQLNDTRYIGRKLSELLKPVVKEDSKIIFTGGSITAELKNNWGLNNVWKKIILPRFERLEEITNNKGEYVIHSTDEHGNPLIHFNVKENPKLNTKRIDHRHHALDALIIAATTREHIRYLNTLNAANTDEQIKNYRRSLVKGKIRDFKLPWADFTKDAKHHLERLIVSFKTNKNIITKPYNRTSTFKIKDGKLIKSYKEQKANPRWMAVRKSMFKEPQGVIHLKEIHEEKNILKAIEIQIDRMLVQNKPEMKTASYVYNQEARKIIKNLIDRIGVPIEEKKELLNAIKKYLKKEKLRDFAGNEFQTISIAKFEEYAAKRVKLDNSFDHKKIDKIPYAKMGKSILGKMLHEHLDAPEFKDDNGKAAPAKAFSSEGLEILTKKLGKPITKVTIYEKKDESSKFGNQYVEVDAGSNVFFVLYENQKTKERTDFKSVSTHKAIEKIVKGEPIAEDRPGYDKIVLSPGDLVYVPTQDERNNIVEGAAMKRVIKLDDNKAILERLYKVVSFSKKDLLCVKANISEAIIPTSIKDKIKGEIDWHNKSTSTMDGNMIIKDVCIKLKVSRIGTISKTDLKLPENSIINASEPDVAFETKKWTLKKFESFEEMDEESARQMASLTPQEHLKTVTELQKTVFRNDLKTPMDKKLKFKD